MIIVDLHDDDISIRWCTQDDAADGHDFEFMLTWWSNQWWMVISMNSM